MDKTKNKVGRPHEGGRHQKQFSCFAPPTLLEQMTKLAQKRNTNRSALIQQAFLATFGHELEQTEATG